MRRVLRHPLGAAGLVVVGGLAVLALVAPVVQTHDPTAIDLSARLLPPSPGHWLGTDRLGRDVWSRLVAGARVSLGVGFIAVGIATVIGITVGSLAGYYGGRIDAVLMRAVDVCLCVPTFFLILAVIAVVGPGLVNIMVVIGVTSWMGVARLIRGEILSLKERDFVVAARALGLSDARIIVRHLIPNAMAPVWVSATLGVAAAVLVESSLSFLGLGVQPPTPTWGNMLTEAKATLGSAWWMTVCPGVAIFLTVLGYNFLGEGLRDVLSPRHR